MVRNQKLALAAVVLVGIAIIVGWILVLTISPAVEPVAVETPTETPSEVPWPTHQIIGESVEGRPIDVYEFGTASTSVLLVGGVHGGYEWNSALLAYQMIAYFTEDKSRIPEDVAVHIIPVLNPDGLAVVLANGVSPAEIFTAADVVNWNSDGRGRFNANNVDLNRNFNCKWQPDAAWRGVHTSAGTTAFSEPEAIALRDYVAESSPVAVAFWHSVSGNVYGSECDNGILPETSAILSTYADSADYGAVPIFDTYPVTGDAEGWLASIGIPAITVELKERNSTEWEQNLAGTTALINHYSNLAK